MLGDRERTLFLNCLWMASSASLIVTPFMLRAETSRPRGKCRVIFLTFGMHNGRARYAGSSTVDGDLFSFLYKRSVSGNLKLHRDNVNGSKVLTRQSQRCIFAKRRIELTTLASVSRERC